MVDGILTPKEKETLAWTKNGVTPCISKVWVSEC